MRIHTNTLTRRDVINAVGALSGIYVEGAHEHGSRTHTRAFEVQLTGSSPRRRNTGQYGASDERAASWDEWGMVLAALYAIDSEMVVGSVKRPIYANADHFHAVTCDRYRTLTPAEAHHAHHWTYAPWSSGSTIGTCTGRNGCGAEMNRGALASTYATA